MNEETNEQEVMTWEEIEKGTYLDLRKNTKTFCDRLILKSDSYVYALRRRVVNCINEIKQAIKDIADIPRVRIRIIKDFQCRDNTVAGVGHNKCIWICESLERDSNLYLFQVVAHELGHAVFNLKHDSNCPLMSPNSDPNKPLKKEIVINSLRKQIEAGANT